MTLQRHALWKSGPLGRRKDCSKPLVIQSDSEGASVQCQAYRVIFMVHAICRTSPSSISIPVDIPGWSACSLPVHCFVRRVVTVPYSVRLCTEIGRAHV